MDMAMVGGIISSLKSAGDIAGGLVGLRDESKMAAQVLELQQLILAAT